MARKYWVIRFEQLNHDRTKYIHKWLGSHGIGVLNEKDAYKWTYKKDAVIAVKAIFMLNEMIRVAVV